MKTTVSGRVIKGKGKGRRLGFPTVNLELHEKIESGVYAGLVNIDNRKYKAGIFVSPDKKFIEAHLIGFSGDLYGIEIEIEIREKVREIMKFGSDEELEEQIKSDIKKYVYGDNQKIS